MDIKLTRLHLQLLGDLLETLVQLGFELVIFLLAADDFVLHSRKGLGQHVLNLRILDLRRFTNFSVVVG